jgi:CheY-like chemotaxis protein
MDGREVLRDIKGDPDLKEIPVIVLTTSNWPQDVLNAYQSQANFFITKPEDLHRFIAMMTYVEEIWLKTLIPSPG